ncbi:hypothetical protein ACTID9_19675 [Brevibacillus fluminis]|uniref:hypothetical protein n=1 Tax=Brevibacillus fluminis TaxID=511487 RepID=UPI003F893228
MKRPTYTSASFIKKVFRPGERSLPRNEFLERLDQTLREADVVTPAESMLQEVLAHPAGPVRIGRSEAILELTYAPHQVFDLAYRFMRETHLPRSLDQIIPELRKRTSFSWNQVSRMLELERDPRFVQYEGDPRWYLVDWKLANDLLYTFAVERKFQQLALRSYGHVLEVYLGLNAKEYVFLPEMDDRFQVEGEVVYIRSQAEETTGDAHQAEAAATLAAEAASADVPVEPVEAEAADAPVAVEAAHAAEATETDAPQVEAADEQNEAQVPEATEETDETESTEETDESTNEGNNASTITIEAKEELGMNTTLTKPVLHEVDELLKKAVALLETRNHDMGQEVVNNFQQSNMQAIEELMQEKWKNEQLVQGIQQVLAAIGQ